VEPERPAFWKDFGWRYSPHTPKQGHEIIPTVTAKGRFLGVSNVLTNGVKADGEICAFVFVYTLMRLFWEI
jgi:hypothetical protein